LNFSENPLFCSKKSKKNTPYIAFLEKKSKKNLEKIGKVIFGETPWRAGDSKESTFLWKSSRPAVYGRVPVTAVEILLGVVSLYKSSMYK
jgi:hypothetical protein